MGINPHSLSKAARVAGGITIVNGKARPQLAMPVPGWCWWFLDMEPPTVTHGDKDIGWRRSRRTGANVPTIVKNPKLKAVWDLYCRHIQDRPTLIPLSAPVALHATFWFPLRPDDQIRDWHTEKPDLDNQVKVLKDVLALKGYLEHDQHVAKEVLAKLRGSIPCVIIYARSLGRFPLDEGQVHLDPHEMRHFQQGVIHPIPEAVAHELEIVRLCQNGTRRAAEIGTPGGKRRPDRPRPRIEAAAGRIQGSADPSSAPNGVTGVDSPAPQKGGKRKRS